MFARLFQRLPRQARVPIQTALFGLLGGLVAVAFQKTVWLLYTSLWLRLAELPPWKFVTGSFVVIVAASLISGWLLARFCPAAAGSGLPQLKAAYWRDFGNLPWRVTWVKFVAGAISVGGGLSLGREGPTVQMAGGVASAASSLLGVAKQDRRPAMVSGAAAGLAAAFNTPIAAVTFVLEEIIEDLNSRVIGRVLLASVLGAAVLYFLVGKEPAFHIPGVTDFGWRIYLFGPLAAAGAGLIGVLFQRATLGWRVQIREEVRLAPWLRPLVGGLITWAIGCGVFLWVGKLGVFSLGYDDLTAALNGQLVWKICLLLLVGKLVATAASFAWGGCGGIFAPCLFLGGMTGAVAAALAGTVSPLRPDERMVLAIVGMSACLGAVVRAPVTSILIVFEMTHEFALVPILMLGAIASQGVSRLFCARNFYAQILHDDGEAIEKHITPRSFGWWFYQPVETIMNRAPRSASDLSPAGLRALLAGNRYERFPALDGTGRVAGILTRAEAERSLEAGEPPRLQSAARCGPDQPIGEAQQLLADAENQILVVAETEGPPLGLLTLHDLLRAQLVARDMEGE